MKYFSFFSLKWWLWLKAGLYILYFFFIQVSNHTEPYIVRFFVNTLFCVVAIGVIEVSLYSLQLLFRRRRYKKAVLIWLGCYMLLAITGYILLHGSQNIFADLVWNRQFEASWGVYLSNFNVFFVTFLKYAVMLFLVRQLLFFARLVNMRRYAKQAVAPQMQAVLSEPPYRVEAWAGVGVESVLKELPDHFGMLSVKVGTVTHMLDIQRIVYLEVQDEITTVYQTDGEQLEVKIPLSRFYEQLPKHRFVRIHDSRVVALPYIVREKQGHVYMQAYEDRGLKLGKHERFPEYKEWKERLRLK